MSYVTEKNMNHSKAFWAEVEKVLPDYRESVQWLKEKGSLIMRRKYIKTVRAVGEIEKHHEDRYRALLKNLETAQVFEKSEVKVWECRNCGHIVIGTKSSGGLSAMQSSTELL